MDTQRQRMKRRKGKKRENSRIQISKQNFRLKDSMKYLLWKLNHNMILFGKESYQFIYRYY
jgi:hypothetical protein